MINSTFINGDKMKKWLSLIMIAVIVLLFSGCKEQYLTLQYEGNEYLITYNWKMKSDLSVRNDVVNEGTKLHLKVSEHDLNKEFVYCINSDSLYHKKDSEYPNNDTESIQYLVLDFPHRTKTIAEKMIIQELIDITQGNAKNDIDVDDNICTISIYYNNYPAYLLYGCIIKDTNGNYWLREDSLAIDPLNQDVDFFENYYYIAFDSLIQSNM